MMLKKIFPIILLILLSSCASNKMDLNDLEGTWILIENYSDNTLKYQKIPEKNLLEGSILKINNDSTIIDAYQYKCPQGVSAFYSKGTWSLDRKKMILSSSVPFDLRDSSYKIIELDSSCIVFGTVN
ncbi:lipocalin family protein [Flavobacterium sp. ASW18X]|uniref:lipocalin family protein n=1 Tax=Flavobacterium sp. ASW18X TaxID=2572595 RepID=UPI001469C0AD|nr:lipocalin family protein [Flavobacterium sp. ASW18X]